MSVVSAMKRLAICLFFLVGLTSVKALDPGWRRGVIRLEREDGVTVSFDVELASTDAERSRGLMGRRALQPTHGMLFDFGTERPIVMWMHDTHISLDMLFVNAQGIVVDVRARTTPLSDELLPGAFPARYVVELAGGQAAANALVPGVRLVLPDHFTTSPSAN